MSTQLNFVNRTPHTSVLFIQVGPASVSGDLYTDASCLPAFSIFKTLHSGDAPQNSDLAGQTKDGGTGTRTIIFRTLGASSTIKNGSVVTLWAPINRAVSSCVAWLVPEILINNTSPGFLNLRDCSVGPTPGVTKVEFTLNVDKVTFNISFVDGFSCGANAKYTSRGGIETERDAVPTPPDSSIRAAADLKFKINTYGSALKVYLSDKHVESETETETYYGLSFTRRQLISAGTSAVTGFNTEIPLHQNMSRRFAHSLVTTFPSPNVSFVGFIHSQRTATHKMNAYSWAYDEVRCLQDGCGYDETSQTGGGAQPQPTSDSSHRTFLSQAMPTKLVTMPIT